MAITDDEFKKSLQQWASGVTVVATHSADLGKQGMTVTAFSSVSLTPPQILVCINQSADTGEGIGASGRFSVNVLSDEQQEISTDFAGGLSQKERFEKYPWSEGIENTPLLDNCLLSLDCRVVDKVAAGSHWVIVGEVEYAIYRSGNPLIYFRGQYRKLADS